MQIFQPVFANVLVRRAEKKGATAGGVLIPETAKEKPLECEVIAVGPGKHGDIMKALAEATDVPVNDIKNSPGFKALQGITGIPVRIGDRVLIKKWAGFEVTLSGIDFLVIDAEEILGVLVDRVAEMTEEKQDQEHD